ncbi:MAG: hypothetical protein A2Y24_02530 [Clostridiales bacterium GWE2_32_10]|nr:MAG: hypothetical protein A2Y24_02530 [Clostridiales bacterium GWE2_32_10]HBY21150.1 hypothetical protein [Clostridiales bacterium]
MNKLKQRKLFASMEVEILDKGLSIKEKEIGKYVEFSMPYEKITKDVAVRTKNSEGWYTVAILFIVFTLLFSIPKLVNGKIENIGKDGEFIWLTISIICFCTPTILITKFKYITNTDNKAIYFFYDKKNQEELDEFLKSVFEKRDIYLKKRYSKIDMDFSKEKNLDKIEWLRNEEVINESEYNELRNKIINFEKDNRNQTGFKI